MEDLLFEANFFGTWMPVLVGFNTYHTYGSTEYTFSGGFYHTSTAVPEPSTLLLLGSGLVGLTAYKRRLRTAYYNGRYAEAEDNFLAIIEANTGSREKGAKSLVNKARLRLGVLKMNQGFR